MSLTAYLRRVRESAQQRRLILALPWRKKLALAVAATDRLLARERCFGLPVYYQIEVTRRCNLSCDHCPRHAHSSPNADMPPDMYRRIIDDNPALCWVHLQGLGEPTLHPDIDMMIRYAKRRGIITSLTTNGTQLDLPMVRRLAGAELDRLCISIDAVGEQAKHVRRGTRWGTLDHHLRCLRARIDQVQSELQIVVWVTVHAATAKSCVDVVQYAKEIGASSVHVQHVFPLEDYDVRQVNEWIADVCRIEKLPCDISTPTPVGARWSKCSWPWLSAYVSCDGAVRVCCNAFDDCHNLGNLAQQSIRSIWNTTAYHAFRCAFNRQNVPVLCKGCANL